MTSTLIRVLDQEVSQIQNQIAGLQSQLQAIESLRARRSGFTVHDGGQLATKKKSTKRTKTKKKASQMSSMDMARLVLDNNGGKRGSEMSFPQIRDAIKQTFGVEPARSLDQMLYKRGRAKRGFYRTSDGLYGRIEWTQKQVQAA